MDTQILKAFDFAADATKQLITLATGILALTVTFDKDILLAVKSAQQGWLYAAWVVYLVSVVCGIMALLAMTGSLSKPNAAVMGSNIRIWSIAQIILFLAGTGLIVVFGVTAR